MTRQEPYSSIIPPIAFGEERSGACNANRYQFLERVCVGGEAHIYLAKCVDGPLKDRLVIIKVKGYLLTDACNSSLDCLTGTFQQLQLSHDDLKRMERYAIEEAGHVTIRLNHEVIIKGIDTMEWTATVVSGVYRGFRVKLNGIVMDRMEGGNLNEFVVRQLNNYGFMPPHLTLNATLRMLIVLIYLEGTNTIHRDLSLGNLMFNRYSEIFVGDFGLAIDTVKNTPISFVGSPGLQAPEVFHNKQYDRRVDWFTAGLLFVAMHTFQDILTKFRDANGKIHMSDWRQNIMNDDATKVRPEYWSLMPPIIWYVVSHVVEKDPANRYPLAQLMDAFQKAEAGVVTVLDNDGVALPHPRAVPPTNVSPAKAKDVAKIHSSVEVLKSHPMKQLYLARHMHEELTSLCELAGSSPSNIIAILAAGGVRAAMTAVCNYLNHVDIMEVFLTLLSILATTAEGITAIANVGGIQFLSSCMLSNKWDTSQPRIWKKAIDLLFCFAHHPGWRLLVLRSNVINVIGKAFIQSPTLAETPEGVAVMRTTTRLMSLFLQNGFGVSFMGPTSSSSDAAVKQGAVNLNFHVQRVVQALLLQEVESFCSITLLNLGFEHISSFCDILYTSKCLKQSDVFTGERTDSLILRLIHALKHPEGRVVHRACNIFAVLLDPLNPRSAEYRSLIVKHEGITAMLDILNRCKYITPHERSALINCLYLALVQCSEAQEKVFTYRLVPGNVASSCGISVLLQLFAVPHNEVDTLILLFKTLCQLHLYSEYMIGLVDFNVIYNLLTSTNVDSRVKLAVLDLLLKLCNCNGMNNKILESAAAHIELLKNGVLVNGDARIVEKAVRLIRSFGIHSARCESSLLRQVLECLLSTLNYHAETAEVSILTNVCETISELLNHPFGMQTFRGMQGIKELADVYKTLQTPERR